MTKLGRPSGQYLNRKYTFQHSLYKKFPPQVHELLELIVYEKKYTESELMERFREFGLVNTTQDPWRVFCYYRSKMISGGALKMENR